MAQQSQRSGKLRFGVVGCGAVGPTHCAAIAQIPDAELVAVADIVPERARKTAEKFGVARVYGDYSEMLADKDIDIVSFATPSGMHADHAIAAMRAGKHVIVEKPMEITLEQCDRMIAAEDATGMKLAVISQHRWDAATMLVRDVIQSGRLGKIILADASVKWWRRQEYYDSGDWRGTWALDGGGALMNQGVHTVDVLQYLVGGVQSVFGHIKTGAHDRIEVEDIAVAALGFKCGAVGTLTATTAAFSGLPVRIDIYGTEGTAIIEGDRLKLLSFKNGQTISGEEAAAHAVSVAQGGTASVKDEAATRSSGGGQAQAAQGAVWGDAHRAQILDFMNAVRNGHKPLIDGRAARQPVQIILGIYQSARTGQPVMLG